MKRKGFFLIAGLGKLIIGLVLAFFLTACEKEYFQGEKLNENLDVTFRQGEILVQPLEHDFGEVLVGKQAPPLTITIQNISPLEPLAVNAVILTSNHEFYFLQNEVQYQLQPGQRAEVILAFTPSAEIAYETSVRVYSSDHYSHEIVEIPINGEGISNATPPPTDPIELENYYTTSVETGKITILDPDFSDKVELAAQFYEEGKIKEACKKLQWLYERCDGLLPPPDMITEEKVGELREYLLGVMEELGCL